MNSKSTIVREMYLKLRPMQIIGIIVNAINSLIDSTVTSRVLGEKSLSAIGFFSPLGTIIGVLGVFTVGIQVLCGQYIGRCEKKKIKSLFSTGVLFLVIVGLTISILMYIFATPISGVLGAKGDVKPLLKSYMYGYSLGVVGQIFSGFCLQLLPYNNKTKLAYFGIGTLVVTNIALDIIFTTVFNMGTFGMGLATAISFLASSAIMFTGFLRRDNTVYFCAIKPQFRLLWKAAYRGIPSLTFTLGIALKGFIMNRTIMKEVGYEMVAVMNVQGSLCGFLGAIPVGAASAYLVLATMFYGEDDRQSLMSSAKYALRYGLILSTIVVAVLMGGCTVISSIYFKPSSTSWAISRNMLLIFPCFLILNTVYSILANTYHAEGRMKIVSTMSGVTQITSVAIAVAGLKLIGPNGVWLSYPLNEVVGISILLAIAFIHARRIRFDHETIMMIEDDFGASDDDLMEFRVESMEDVINISDTIDKFCRSKGIQKRYSKYAGLCIEEMAGNTIKHGFVPGEKHHLDIRVVARDNITIRLRDDCTLFDPKTRIEQVDDNDLVSNFGIRLIAKVASDVTYQNSIGINTLIMKVDG